MPLTSRSGTRPNKPAGTTGQGGYILIRIDYIQHKAHRLAWLYMTGAFPEGVIDHLDANTSNNRWVNLRDVTREVNNQNVRAARRDNASGFPGVSKIAGRMKWKAAVRIGGKPVYLGSFDDPEEAYDVYLEAKTANQNGFIPSDLPWQLQGL